MCACDSSVHMGVNCKACTTAFVMACLLPMNERMNESSLKYVRIYIPNKMSERAKDQDQLVRSKCTNQMTPSS